MTALEKTKNLVRKDVPVEKLIVQELNPNKMSDREFDLLIDNINKTGLTDPILVRETEQENYRIIGGHHRYDAAKFLGFETVPCTIITDPDFDEEDEEFQIIRMNVIHGKLDPSAFFVKYDKMSEKYSDALLQDMYGFAEEAEFKKLIAKSAKMLPDKASQDAFKEAAKEIKTIDGISQLLNEMFTRYGDTVPNGFMVLDYGGKKSVWIDCSKKTMDAVYMLREVCIDKKRTMDDIVGKAVQLIASGQEPELLDRILDTTVETKIPESMPALPTKQNLDLAAELDD